MWVRILKWLGLKRLEKDLGTSDPTPSVREFDYSSMTVEPGPWNTVYDMQHPIGEVEVFRDWKPKVVEDNRNAFGKRLDEMNEEPLPPSWEEVTHELSQQILDREDEEFQRRYEQLFVTFKPGNEKVVGKKLQAPPKRVKIATPAKKKKKRTLK